MNIPTAHIEAKKSQISKKVLMFGDPLRAKKAAETFLTNYKLVNNVRGMLIYTGIYKNEVITLMGHGMGLSSISIYAYELYKFYGVEVIVRAGSCGALKKEIKLNDIILSTVAYTDAENFGLPFGEVNNYTNSSNELINIFKEVAKLKKVKTKLHEGSILSSQWFYKEIEIKKYVDLIKEKNILVVEMEAYALYTIANKLKKKALTVLTVSDSLVTHEQLSSRDRQESFIEMMELGLETLLKA